MTEEIRVNHGTTTVGILCTDGVVLAADKRASLGNLMVGEDKMNKIFPITDKIAITHAGTVSDAQLLTKLIKSELQLKKIRTGREPLVKEAANLLAGMMYQNVRMPSMIPGIVGINMGGIDGDGFHLYNLGMDGSVMEKDDFATDGSGLIFATPILDAEYKQGITVEEGIKLAIKAVNASLKRDLATGNGIDIFTITKDGVKKVMTKFVQTTIQ